MATVKVHYQITRVRQQLEITHASGRQIERIKDCLGDVLPFK